MLRCILFLFLLLSSFSSFAELRKGFLYNKGFTGYNYKDARVNHTDDKREKKCEIFLNDNDADPIEVADCKVFTGENISEGISELEAFAEEGNIKAMQMLVGISAGSGYSKNEMPQDELKAWEIYRITYWNTKLFETILGDIDNTDMDFRTQRKLMKKYHFRYNMPLQIYSSYIDLYIDNANDPKTFFQPHMVDFAKDAIYFYDHTCPVVRDASDYWSEKDIDVLLEFCHKISNRFFKPMHDLEIKRIEAFKKCQAKEKYVSDDKAYELCPSYKAVIDKMNTGPATAGSESDIQKLIDYMLDIRNKKRKKIKEYINKY